MCVLYLLPVERLKDYASTHEWLWRELRIFCLWNRIPKIWMCFLESENAHAKLAGGQEFSSRVSLKSNQNAPFYPNAVFHSSCMGFFLKFVSSIPESWFDDQSQGLRLVDEVLNRGILHMTKGSYKPIIKLSFNDKLTWLQVVSE